MEIRELRAKLGVTQSEFAERYDIPFRTVQNWEAGIRKPPKYVMTMLEQRIRKDLVNCKTVELPKYDSRKKSLPRRSDYVGALAWLKAVKEIIGVDIVFALDDALICQGVFNGHSDEYVVWIYGPEEALCYNGVAILGDKISTYCIREENGIKFTDFSRTLNDALANERILDMQGITEAVSKYYYSNAESFSGLSVSPEYQEGFEKLAEEAIDYYNS